MPRILYVCHNHPTIRAGGAEVYAYELFRAVRDQGEFDVLFVAKGGPPFSERVYRREGSRFGLVDGDPREYFFYTSREEFDGVLGTARRKGLYIDDWRRFLEVHQPDVVHFHHSLFLGYDMLRVTRATLPHAPIVYTLHDFMPICHQNGKMVRTEEASGGSLELCDHASPRRCYECFPNIGAQTFLLRERFIKAAFEHVDMFIAPSRVLAERFIAWGLPEDKVRHEDHGRLPLAALPDPPDAGRRRRLGFFGQITPFKGVDVLVEAMALLPERGIEAELLLHGANFAVTPEPFQEKLKRLLESATNVRFTGPYQRERVPELLADVDWVVVPSLWWENSPLVIQEAQMCGRPVICSDAGGMAEKVRDGVDGLHFRIGDAGSLATVIARAVSEPELWEQLRAQSPDVPAMAAHLATIGEIYEELLRRMEQPAAV